MENRKNLWSAEGFLPKKNFYRAKRVSLQFEIWKGTVSQSGPGDEFRGNVKINVSWTSGSHISRFLSIVTENHDMDSILVDCRFADSWGLDWPDNSENHPSNDQTFQTSVQTYGQLII